MTKKDLSVNMLRRFLQYRQKHFSHVLKLILFSVINMLTNRDSYAIYPDFFEVIVLKILTLYQSSNDLLLYGSALNGQDEPNRVLWLAAWGGKMKLSCPLGIPAVSHGKNFPESQIMNPLMIKLFRSRWLDVGLVLFMQVYGPWLHLSP